MLPAQYASLRQPLPPPPSSQSDVRTIVGKMHYYDALTRKQYGNAGTVMQRTDLQMTRFTNYRTNH